MNHESFAAFMEQVVLPKQAAGPAQIRLDGQLSGGNREPAGFFLASGKALAGSCRFAFRATDTGLWRTQSKTGRRSVYR